VDFGRRWEHLQDLKHRLAQGSPGELARELLETSSDGKLKMYVIFQALAFRRRNEEFFRKADYLPLQPEGKRAGHLCAFARRLETAIVLTVIPLRLLKLSMERPVLPIGPALWQDTRLVLPGIRGNVAFRNVFTGEEVPVRSSESGAVLSVADVLARFPVALLAGNGVHA